MRIFFTWHLLPVLVVALPVFWIVLERERARLWFIVLLSLSVQALLQPIFSCIACGLIITAHQIVKARKAGRLTDSQGILAVVSVSLLAIAARKYRQSGAILLWGSGEASAISLAVPLGISYFVFRLLQYVFDHERGILVENSLLKLGAFLMFLPTLPAGPIETYQGFYEKRSTHFDQGLFNSGLRRIVLGYFKKICVVSFLFDIVVFDAFIAKVIRADFAWSDSHPFWPITYVIIFFVRAYFDLSAYTDLAIGYSGLFGFRIVENFHWPFWKRNLAEFWRGWHISLSNWCRNNVYFPVFGLTRKPWLGLYASMLTMGLWHYVSVNWAVWGLYHATGLVVFARWGRYKKARRKARQLAGKMPTASYERFTAWLAYPVTFVFVALGYSFVSTRSFAEGSTLFYHSLRGPIVWLSAALH